jgi:SNF2 family DNA or RNA helicase
MNSFKNFLSKAGLDTEIHQLEGVDWCHQNEVHGHKVDDKIVRGGLLADEMGLGKTIQMLGTMSGNPKDHTLIVLPKSLLKQWKDDIVKTLGIEPLTFHDTGKRNATRELLENSPIVLTTYSLITERTTKQKTSKKEKSHNYQPVSNAFVRKFIKKRTKSQVGINLPELRTNTISVKWENEAERNLAEDFHSMLQFTHVSKSPTKINNSIAVMGLQAGSMILPLLIKARQMCILPSLVEKSLKHFTEIGLMEENKETLEALHKSSSKMDAVINTLIERKNNGRQKLIFCHFRGEIDYIKKSLEEQGQMKIMTFDGRTPEKERKEALSSENRIDVLILQIQTGCEGLNLQHFSEVYFVSPHWNPAVEDQAIARCHRMGQNSGVDVFRFAMAGFDEKNETRSLDEYASNLQDAKRDVMKIIDEEPEPITK